MPTVRSALPFCQFAHWAIDPVRAEIRSTVSKMIKVLDPAKVTEPYCAVLFFGPPGTGKGTQAQFLSQLTGHFHLSAGDIFRGLPPDSPLGELQRQYVDKGLLLPDELAVEIWRKYTLDLVSMNRYRPGEQLLLTDGMPRTPKQAQLLEQAMVVKRVIALETGDEACLIERLHKRAMVEGRADDQDEQILRRRLSVYNEQSRDVLQTFPRETIVNIRADQKPFEVLRDILFSMSDLLRYPERCETQ